VDLKLIEDLMALRDEGSFVRAAQARHVTHPAFGRRIRALEAWVGAPLVNRQHSAAGLTPAATALLAQAQPLLQALLQHRAALSRRGPATSAPVLRIGTGRTLARTLVADWLARQRLALRGCRVEIHTRTMAEIAQVLERGEVDLLCCYEHPLLSLALNAQRFVHLSLAQDRLLPVSRADANGQARFALGSAPLIAYAQGLALGAITGDHWRANVPDASERVAFVCDSADAMLELALKGLGVAWLPRSLVAADCKRGLLQALGGKAQELPFEVRLYRPKARQSAVVEAAWAHSVKV
jgi:LysR family transcriptional regulator, hypochlorite-specific transcription factor HypT